MMEEKNVVVIKVIGVGGGGGNAVNTMVEAGMRGVEFVAANTDLHVLEQSRADTLLQLGPSITKGMGAGSLPERGEEAARESEEQIRAMLKGSDMVFVTAGLGGGTGTGAAPVIVELAKELGILTVAVVTKPFAFEGKKRSKNAEEGWENLARHADTIITIPNDRLVDLMQRNSKLVGMFHMADNVLLQAVRGITDLINEPGYINVDFADLRSVMREVGPAMIGAGEARGENRAEEAALAAVENPLLEEGGIDGARGILVNISASRDTLTMNEFQTASQIIEQRAHEDANIIIGALFDENIEDRMRVTIVATGINRTAGDPEVITEIAQTPSISSLAERDLEGGRPEPDPPMPAAPSRPTALRGQVCALPRREGPGPEVDLDQPAFIRRQRN